eukprot:Nk52_evm4s70 gene=Nk52_evmTU4s70
MCEENIRRGGGRGGGGREGCVAKEDLYVEEGSIGSYLCGGGLSKKAVKGGKAITVLYSNGSHDCASQPSEWVFPRKPPRANIIWKLPLASFMILGVEVLERYTYYGIVIQFNQYGRDMLGLDVSTTSAIVQGFLFWTYFCSAVFAFVADAVLGKFKSILIGIGFYLFGLTLLVITSSPLGFGDYPQEPDAARWGFWISLIAIGVGGGAMKPNIAPMCIEQQFKADDTDNSRVMHYLYFFVNLGGVAGMFISPYLSSLGTKEGNGGVSQPTSYYIPYAVACGAFYVAASVFLIGTNYYTHRLPTRSAYMDVYHVVKSAIRNRGLSYEEAALHQTGNKHNCAACSSSSRSGAGCVRLVSYPPRRGSSESLSVNGFSNPYESGSMYNMGALVGPDSLPRGPIIAVDGDVALTYSCQNDRQNPLPSGKACDIEHEEHWIFKATGHSYETIKSVRRLFRILPFCLYFVLYFLLYNQFATSFIQMAGWTAKPSWVTDTSLNSIDPMTVLILIPIHIGFIFPLLRERVGFEMQHVSRMMFGFALMGISYVCASAIQFYIISQGDIDSNGEFVANDGSGATSASISVWWLVPVFFFMGASELWAQVTFMEFCYSQAPKTLVSTVMCGNYMCIGLGSLLAIALGPVFKPEYLVYTLPSLAGCMLFIVLPVFYWHFSGFVPEKNRSKDEPKCPSEANIHMYKSQLSEDEYSTDEDNSSEVN